MTFALEGTVTGRVANELRAITILSPDASSPFFAELLPRLGIGPILLLPLLANGQLFGVLSISRDTGHPQFDDADEERLGVMADLAALALWKARLLEDARSADAAKTSLLATLSHELRTPLTALEGYSELLEDQILGPLSPEQQDVVMRLRTVGRHLGSLIEDILTYASLEADRLTARHATVRVPEVLDSLHPFIEPLAREKGIEFSIDLEPGLPSMHTDEDRVRQILLNLCQNAVKFTEEGAASPADRRWPMARPRSGSPCATPASGSSPPTCSAYFAPSPRSRTCRPGGIGVPAWGSTSRAASPPCLADASRSCRAPVRGRCSPSCCP